MDDRIVSLSIFLGDQLIDRDAEIRADRVSPRPRSGQQGRSARMIAAGLFLGRQTLRGMSRPLISDNVIAERLQRFGDERELEVLTFLQRTPVAGRRAVRMPDTEKRRGTEPGAAAVLLKGVCAGSIDSRKGSAKVAPTPREKCAARNVFLCNEHDWPPFSSQLFRT